MWKERQGCGGVEGEAGARREREADTAEMIVT